MIRNLILLLGSIASIAAAADAPGGPLATRDSFRIGSSGVLCTAQLRLVDPALTGMFDRGYAITCRDAAAPIGALYAVRDTADARLATLIARRGEPLTCAAPARETLAGFGPVELRTCTGGDSKLPYNAYSTVRRGTRFVSVGLAGYDPALRLGLQSLVTDRPSAGAVEVASTSAGDPAAFARVQAGALDPSTALAQAYERNNAGSFAEAAEFFENLSDRTATAGQADRSAEYLMGQAMQQSNLGNKAAAALLFARAGAAIAPGDPVAVRLLRNYRAMDDLNRHDAAAALAELDTPLPATGRSNDTALAQGTIAPPLAAQLNAASATLDRLSGAESGLLPVERAALLDGQAAQLRGVALRQQQRYPDALLALEKSDRAIAAVREGRVASAAFIRSEGLAETALVREASGQYPAAESALAASLRILETSYPRSAAALAARARFAAFLVRRGQGDRALPLYAGIVADAREVPGSAATMRDLLVPYFTLLSQRASTDQAAAEAMFSAAQILVRPGVAQTQAVFARELSAGDDQAARLFRQSINLTRQVSQASGEVARLTIAGNDAPALATARARLAALEGEQTGLVSRLSSFPRYRVTATDTLDIAALRAAMKDDEGYFMLRVLGRDVYAMLVTPRAVRAYKVATTLGRLSADVAALRASIVTVQDGRSEVFPFDVARARALYLQLFGPVADDLRGVRNLIYEPDGPMLQLPATLLIDRDDGIAAFTARQKSATADAYDYRGIAWLGRDRTVTTAVSPRAFVDVRALAPSRARQAYLGLGHNAVPSALATLLAPAPLRGECDWPIEAWQHPISADELTFARTALATGGTAEITGAAFTDTAVRDDTKLSDYRILHFATHGLVTAPRPQCPARPALLTSFGEAGSDGLLSFREIFDLRLDADVVILSACDTAGMATIEATRDAGVTTGGNFALDGLVRAFIGAGARSVIASHWPIPDDYGATKQIMTALFAAPPGTAMTTSLQSGQRALMDRAETSHPFYWAAFAVIGDGRQPLVRR